MGRRKKPTREELLNYKKTSSLNNKRGQCKDLKTGDMTGALDLALFSLKRTCGRPFKYEPTEEGLKRFTQESIDYLDYCNEVNKDLEEGQKLIPDIEGWAVYLGTTRMTIFEYEKRGGEWAKTINYFKNIIAHGKKELALNGKMAPVLYMFDSANNHNYINTNEFKITATNTVINSEQSQIEQEITNNGLVWDDQEKRFVPVTGETKDVDGRTITESKDSTSEEE